MEKELDVSEILILTNIWTGAAPFFYDGKVISTGMPAFYNVFINLLEDKRISRIHILIWQPNEEIRLPEKYVEKIKYYIIPKCKSSFTNNLKIIYKSIVIGRKIVRKNDKIKNIIGFGSLGGITSIIGRLVKIPDFRRIYGTFLINEINNSKSSIFLRHPLEYITFASKGKGLLVTNDGTKGDIVFKKLGNKSLPFYFPLNGVDKLIIQNIEQPAFNLESEYMIYVARLDPWKRQHLLLLALAELQNKGYDFPKTYIIGAIFDTNYVDKLINIIKDNNLSDKVEVIYGMPIRQVHYMLFHSKLTFSLYHTSNLGNVFIEAMQLGVPTIAINDTGSLDLIEENAYFELKNDEVSEISKAIITLLSDNEKLLSLKNNAIQFANNTLSSWDERIKYEIDLMLN